MKWALAILCALVFAGATAAATTPTLTITPTPTHVGDSVSFLICGLQPTKNYLLAVWDQADTTLYAQSSSRASSSGCMDAHSNGFGGPFWTPTAPGGYSAYVFGCSSKANGCAYGSHLDHPILDVDFTVS